MDGLLVVDKPAGPTSHDVVARVRRLLGERRVGHTGTLDPGATGVLPLVVGRATRLARFLTACDKTYEASVRLGVATDTYDADGTAVGERYEGAWPSPEEIARAVEAFRGTLVQRPPPFSAKKIEGRRSYAVARSGAHPAPASVTVTVRRLDLLDVDADRLSLRVDCSAGFYVRSLAHDLGERLGVGAHLTALRRTRSGDLGVADALPLADAERDPLAARRALIPLSRMLAGISAIVLSEEGVRRASHGLDVRAADVAEGALAGSPIRLLDRSGQLLGVGEATGRPGLLHPSVILV